MARLANLPLGLAADIDGQPLPKELGRWVDNLPESLLQLVSTVATAGGGIWLAGGSVREGLLGLKPVDYDLATTFHPEKIMELFPKSIPTGAQYGTVTVRLDSSDQMYEVTTLRLDQDYTDGRRPESVSFGTSLREDLERRDLTMNAMAIDLARAELYDLFEGSTDLREGVLRAVGVAGERLGEDGLRIMRVYRFMDQKEAGVWYPDEELSAALVDNLGMLDRVSVERIWQEFVKILKGSAAPEILTRINDDGVLAQILPDFEVTMDGQADLRNVVGFDAVAARLTLLLANTDAKRALRRFKAEGKTINAVCSAIALLGELPDATDEKQLRRYRAYLDGDLQRQIEIECAYSPPMGEKVKSALNKLPLNRVGNQPLINGNWIASNLGLESGIRLGRLKEWLHRNQIERDLATIEEVAETLEEIDWKNEDPRSWASLHWP